MLDHEVHGQGDPLLLIHGALVSKTMWAPQLQALSEHFRVIACDLPAHGRSPDLAGDYTVAHLAASVIELLDFLGVDQAHVCGHSLGGMVAQQITLDHPSRVHKLVLAETSFGTQTTLWERLQTYAAKATLLLTPPKLLASISASQYGALNAPVGDYIGQEMANYDRGTILKVMRAALSYSAKGRLGAIQAPTLIVVAEQNKQTHKQGQQMAQMIPHARLEVLPQSHHLLNMDNPQGFNELLVGFLKARAD